MLFNEYYPLNRQVALTSWFFFCKNVFNSKKDLKCKLVCVFPPS